MLSQTFGSSLSASGERFFLFEVEGLRQSTTNDKNDYSFRKSGSVFIKVSYPRMNEEMRRITRMGGKIVSIKPITTSDSTEA